MHKATTTQTKPGDVVKNKQTEMNWQTQYRYRSFGRKYNTQHREWVVNRNIETNLSLLQERHSPTRKTKIECDTQQSNWKYATERKKRSPNTKYKICIQK